MDGREGLADGREGLADGREPGCQLATPTGSSAAGGLGGLRDGTGRAVQHAGQGLAGLQDVRGQLAPVALHVQRVPRRLREGGSHVVGAGCDPEETRAAASANTGAGSSAVARTDAGLQRA